MGILDEDVARVRDATDLVALASEHLALKRVGEALRRAVPVPLREDAVVLDQPRARPLLLLRVPGERRRDHVRARGGAPRLRRRGGAAGVAGGDHAALRRQGRGQGPHQEAAPDAKRSPPRSTSTTSSCSRETTAAWRAALPALARIRRRRGAPVPARLVARRVGPAQRAPADARSSRATTSSTRVSRS